MVLKLYRTTRGALLEADGQHFELGNLDWDELVNRSDLGNWLLEQRAVLSPVDAPPTPDDLLPPIGAQEVWAAGVTYYRSRSARMEESAGEGDYYDRVYSAARPELFFKASPHRVVGPGQQVRIRSDSQWNVPEPELTACVASDGRIVGYTIGNDMSSRDIEGENPLYLPQAKVYDGCCALGERSPGRHNLRGIIDRFAKRGKIHTAGWRARRRDLWRSRYYLPCSWRRPRGVVLRRLPCAGNRVPRG